MYVYMSCLLYLCLCVLSYHRKIIEWNKDSKTNVTRVNMKKRQVKFSTYCIITYIFMLMLPLTKLYLIIPNSKNDRNKNNYIRKVKQSLFYSKLFRIRSSIYSRRIQKYQIKRKDLPTITSLLSTSSQHKSCNVTEHRENENIMQKLNKHCKNVMKNKISKASTTSPELHRF